jgi:hypothetical protein
MSEFDKYVFEIKKENTYWGDWCAKPQGYFRGETSMPGAKYHVGFQTFVGDNVMEQPHFHHGAEEYLTFLGANLPNIFDFDADIDVMVGDDPDHLEPIHINKPTILRIPPNLWHCPISFHIRKPIIFQAAYLDGTWSKITRRMLPDGKCEYIYEGDNVRMCVERPGEYCTICGKCYQGTALNYVEAEGPMRHFPGINDASALDG